MTSSGADPVDVEVSIDRLRETVDVLCVRFHPRSYPQTANIQGAADWIAGRLEETGLETSFQEYTIPEGTFRNVIGKWEGTNPEAGAVVIGAHYDSEAYSMTPGADDNASAVAVLLELAATRPQIPPTSTWYFLAFCTEEPPFFATEKMGSYRFAEKLKNDGVEVSLMISLEMLGYFSDQPGSQRFPAPGLGLIYPDTGNFVAVVGDLGSGASIKRVKKALAGTGQIPVYSFRGPTFVPGIDWSDHWGFRRLGMPAVMLTDTAFMRNPHYHQVSDTPDTLDFERMSRVVNALHGLFQ